MVPESEIRDRVRKVLRYAMRSDAVDNMLDDAPLELDSLASTELLVGLESEFRMVVDDASIGPGMFQDVGTIVALVKRALGAGAPTSSGTQRGGE